MLKAILNTRGLHPPFTRQEGVQLKEQCHADSIHCAQVHATASLPSTFAHILLSSDSLETSLNVREKISKKVISERLFPTSRSYKFSHNLIRFILNEIFKQK
jgi:hypothetical protein